MVVGDQDPHDALPGGVGSLDPMVPHRHLRPERNPWSRDRVGLIVSSPPISSARSRIPAIPRPRSDSSKAKPRPSSATSQLDAVSAGADAGARAMCVGAAWRAAFESASWATR